MNSRVLTSKPSHSQTTRNYIYNKLLTAALLVRPIPALVSVITFLIFLDTLVSVLALELRQLESCSLFLLLDHNYKHLPHLTGSLVAAPLVTLVPAVEVPVTDVLPGDPEIAHGFLIRVKGGPALVVCLVLLAVVWKY